MPHEFLGFCKHFYFGILFRHLVQLINGVGNARIEIFTDIRILSNNARKKGKERERLTCVKVTYRMRNQFGVCVAFSARATFVLFATFRDICSRGMCKVENKKLIFSKYKGICVRCRQSLAKIKNQLQSQDLGATGGVENITEGLSGLSLVSCFKVFISETFSSNIVNESEKP